MRTAKHPMELIPFKSLYESEAVIIDQTPKGMVNMHSSVNWPATTVFTETGCFVNKQEPTPWTRYEPHAKRQAGDWLPSELHLVKNAINDKYGGHVVHRAATHLSA